MKDLKSLLEKVRKKILEEKKETKVDKKSNEYKEKKIYNKKEKRKSYKESKKNIVSSESKIAQVAYALLFDKTSNYVFEVKYSKKFKGYNATAKKVNNKITFNLSYYWKDVDDDIKIGLLQTLLLKLENKNKETINIDLYNNFIKNLHFTNTKKEFDEKLSLLFEKVNIKYFNGLLEKPSLKWEGESSRTLATYNYHDDTIRISNVFKDAPDEILMFLIYHESLHKFLKFKTKGKKTFYHTKQFRRLERMFENFESIEDKIKKYLLSRKKKKYLELFSKSGF